MIKVLVSGYCGHMGKIVCRLIDEHLDFKVVCGFDKHIDYALPYFSCGTIEALATYFSIDKPDIIIDFSSPAATLSILKFAEEQRIPIVIATTGIEDYMADILQASKSIPVFQSANMSYTVILLKKVLQAVAPLLTDSDIEITETHHNRKKDAPSGTAKLLADAINASLDNSKKIVYGRSGKREKDEIGISAIRGGNIVGTHTIQFFGSAETLEFTHIVHSRDVFAQGAIKAAEFLIDKPAGFYNMDNLV